MAKFHGNSASVDMFIIMEEENDAHDASNMQASRTTLSEAVDPLDPPLAASFDIVDANNHDIDVPIDMPTEISSILPLSKSTQQWQNTITGYKKNDSHRLTVKCKAEGCPLTLEDSCIKQATRSCVASIIKERLKAFPHYKPKDILIDIKQEFGIQLNYYQAWRGKEIAREQLQGSYKNAYSTLLAATAADGDDDVFPVAFSVVDAETDENWYWFLLQLKSALSTSCPRTFFADIQKGLRESISEIFKGSYHGYCLRYLTQQLVRDLKGQFSHEMKRLMIDDLHNAALAPRPELFQSYLESIKKISLEAYNWVIQSEPQNWANAYFQGARYNHMTSNFGEHFYSWVSDAHELPITHTVDVIRQKIMELIYTRRATSDQLLTRLTPCMEDRLEKEGMKVRTLQVLLTTESIFEVRGESTEIVDMDHWDCSCKGWQLSALPCCHAIAVGIGRSPYDHCSRYFTTKSYGLTYAESIQPIPDVERPLQKDSSLDLVTVTPPPTRRPPGRPTTKKLGYKSKVIDSEINSATKDVIVSRMILLRVGCKTTDMDVDVLTSGGASDPKTLVVAELEPGVIEFSTEGGVTQLQYTFKLTSPV
ncbi:MuDR family transposase isoform 2 [Hibiscus syriacus]|uniref:MuDR family transposase isoform 2 n=1 Tax=Hibiscus syriacus TaxID=106335 RepID=A0A6A2XMX8_HIBSY|nr:MuDR family transposase isoform 2 [Hibiscus syriacus]